MQPTARLTRLVAVQEDQGFGDFARRALPSLLAVAVRLTGDLASAKDLTQDALVKVGVRWSTVSHGSGNSEQLTYAYRALTTRFSDGRRLHRIRREVLDGAEHGFAERALDVERSLDVRHALLRIPSKMRVALVLRFFLDISEQETANVMGCSVGNVKTQTSRGLARMRGVIHDEKGEAIHDESTRA